MHDTLNDIVEIVHPNVEYRIVFRRKHIKKAMSIIINSLLTLRQMSPLENEWFDKYSFSDEELEGMSDDLAPFLGPDESRDWCHTFIPSYCTNASCLIGKLA
jgi:hypothetical protein